MQGAIIREATFFRGNYPRGQLSRGNYACWQFTLGTIVRGVIILGAIVWREIIRESVFLGGNCPDTKENGGKIILNKLT